MTLMTFEKTFAVLVLSAVALGCSSGESTGKADGSAAAPSDGSASGSRDGGPGGTPGLDGATASQPPAGGLNPEAKRLFPGRARLVGSRTAACSSGNANAANVDRWCAFSQASLSDTELWVINVTKALTTDVKCDGTDPNCKRLTQKLWTEQARFAPVHPSAQRFEGDTLIFHAQAPGPTPERYRGPIFAWRPGWPEPKQISGNNASTCATHTSTDAVLCLENISPEGQPIVFDLTAGRLGAPLKTAAARVTALRPDTQSVQYRIGFSREGEQIIYSSRGSMPTDRETLYMVKIDEVGMPGKTVTVGSDISRWTVSADGTKWYYLKAFNYSADGNLAGNLMMADYPSGGNEQMLAQKVGVFAVISDGSQMDRGLLLIQDMVGGKGAFRLMRDRSAPATLVTLATDAFSGTISRDIRFMLYSTQLNEQTSTSDFQMVKTDGTGACPLVATPTARLPGPAFTGTAGLVFWAESTAAGTLEGWLATPEGCGNKKKFADRVDSWVLRREDGLLVADELEANTVTLRFAPIANGKDVGAPTIIQRKADRNYAVLSRFEAMLFTINSNTPAVDGLYVFTKL